MKKNLTLLLFSCLFWTTMFAQYGDGQLILNRREFQTFGIAPKTLKNEGSIYSSGTTKGVEIIKSSGEHFTIGKPIVQLPVDYLPFTVIKHIDIENDGDWDLIGLSSNKLILHVNLGSNRFSKGRILLESQYEIANLQVLDLQGDGDSDLLLLPDNLSIFNRFQTFINDGKGNFFGNPGEMAGTTLTLFTPGDFDGDKDEDFIFISDKNFATLMLDTGGVNFKKIPMFTIAENITDAVKIDWGSDGDQDVLFIASSGVYLLENESNKGFLPSKNLWRDNFENALMTLLAVNSDQSLDLIIANKGINTLKAYSITKAGLEAPIILDKSYGSPKALRTGDLDGDKDLDIIYSSNVGLFYRNTGTGFIKEPLDGVHDLRDHLEIVDIDNDTLLDIIPVYNLAVKTTNNNDYTIQYINEKPLEQGFNVVECCLRMGDINGDKYPDMLTLEDKCINIYLNTKGNFKFLNKICSNRDEVSQMSLLDLNQDGNQDLIYFGQRYGFPQNDWVVHYNLGNAVFGPPTELAICCATPVEPIYPFTGFNITDLDNDGLAELLVLEGRGIFFQKGLEKGKYATNITTVAGSNNFDALLYDQQILDWNGDGLLDFVGTYEDRPAFIPNLGNLKFGKRQFISDLKTPLLRVGDGNGDGQLDLFYTGENSNIFFHPHKNGAPSRSPIPLTFNYFSPTTPRIEKLYLSDLHNDKDLDLIAMTYNSITAYTNFSEAATISGKVYWDKNRDTIPSTEEPIIPGSRINIEPGALATYTEDDGSYVFYVGTGTFELKPEASECWIPLDTNKVTIKVDANSNRHDFPFVRSANDTTNIQTNLQYGFTRCNTTGVAWLVVSNDGCSIQDLRVELPKNKLLDLKEFSIEPNFNSTNTIYWDFKGILPGAKKTIKIYYQLPGTEMVGNTFFFTANTYLLKDTFFTEIIQRDTFPFVLFCSYDPNDKQVLPFSNKKGNPTYFKNNQLTYTIRFQNSGNDTAFKVVIIDTLHKAIDISTFRPLEASNPYRVELDKKQQIVRFIFDPIILPDSSTNEPASMGFVTFAVSFFSNTPLGTVLANRAGIYFDQNPPIITNTRHSPPLKCVNNISQQSPPSSQ